MSGTISLLMLTTISVFGHEPPASVEVSPEVWAVESSPAKHSVPMDSPEHPCAGQADFIDRKWKSDFRKGVYTCWCEGLLYPPNSSSSPCYDRLVKKRKAVCTTCDTPKAADPVIEKIAPIGIKKIIETIEAVHDSVTDTTKPPKKAVIKRAPLKREVAPPPLDLPLALTRNERAKVLARIESNPHLKQLYAVFQRSEAKYVSESEAKKEAKDLLTLLEDYPGLSIAIYATTHTAKQKEIKRHYQSLYMNEVKEGRFSDADLDEKTEADCRKTKSLAFARAVAGVRILRELGLPQHRIRSYSGVNSGEALAVPIKDFVDGLSMPDKLASKNRRLIIEYYDIDGKVLNPIKY